MKNMKLGKKEIKLLLYLGGLVLALLIYQFYFTKALERIETKKAEKVQLQTELDELKMLESKQEEFENDTNSMKADNKSVIAKFPVGVKEEDAILYAKAIQDSMSMPISSVGLSEGILVYAYGQGLASDDTTETTDAQTTEATETTDAQATEATETTDTQATEATGYSNLMLYKMPVSFSYTVDYGNMKKCLDYIKGSSRRASLDTISLTYDTATGNLMGTMEIGMYYLTGTDQIYEAPKLPDVGTGTGNIFGTVK